MRSWRTVGTLRVHLQVSGLLPQSASPVSRSLHLQDSRWLASRPASSLALAVSHENSRRLGPGAGVNAAGG